MRFVYRTKQFILIAGDIIAYFLAFFLSLFLRHFTIPDADTIERHIGLFILTFFFWIVVNYINGLYDLEQQANDRRFFRRLFETAFFSLIVSVTFFYLFPDKSIAPKTILVFNIGIGYGLSTLWRMFYNKFLGLRTLRSSILLVGYSPETHEVIDIILNRPKKGYKIAALIDPSGEYKITGQKPFDIYTSLTALRPAITNHRIRHVVIAPHLTSDPTAMRELYELLFWPVQIVDLYSFYENITGRIHPSVFSEGWFLQNLRNTSHPVYTNVRTLLDYFFAGALGLLTLLLLPFIALAIKINSKGPVFLKQERVGLYGKHFMLYKFRSMYALSPDGSAETEGYQFAQKDDKRITLIGKFLRKTRIDELPQMWNILKRDITLIGPRPERPEIVKDLTSRIPYYPLRHVVRPGLTGWAAIHQHYTDNIEKSLEKLQYDLYYIKNRSFLLDIAIVLRTVNVVLRLMGQ